MKWAAWLRLRRWENQMDSEPRIHLESRVRAHGWVFSNGMRPVLIGLAIGLAAAIMIARALRSLLFGISATDFMSLGTIALVLLLTSALACYLPAHRAAQLDPVAALRDE